MLIKYLYISLGFIFVVLGYIGIIVPGIPTTPFLLLSVWFFSRSSKSFENWLLNHKIFGEFIKNWQKNKGINRKSKIYAIILILLTFTITIYFKFALFVDILLAIFGILLCLFIIMRPEP